MACDTLADTLQKLFETAQDAGKHIDEIRIQITNVIESQKDNVKSFLEISFDDALQEALANVEETTAKNVAQAKKQLAATAGDSIFTLEKVAGINTGVMDPSTKEKIQELESNVKPQKKEIQDETVSMLSDCIKLLVLKKLDTLTILLVFAIDKLFDAVQELYKTATEYQLDQRQLHSVVLHDIETFHTTFQSKVSLEVQRAVLVLDSIMENGGDNEDA